MRIPSKIAAWGSAGGGDRRSDAFAMPTYRQGGSLNCRHDSADFFVDIAGKPAHLTDLKGKA